MAPAPLLPHRARFLPGAAAWPGGRARLLHESFVHAQRRRPQRRVRADGGRPASHPKGRGGHVRLPGRRRPGRPTLPAAPAVPLSLRGAELPGRDPPVTDALPRTQPLSRRYRSLLAVDLSHGETRRLELAITLAVDPPLLLLDEPTGGMSPEETDATMVLIRELAAGRTIVLVEHKMKLVMKISDRITVLHQGQVIAEGTPEEIRANARVQQTYLGAWR